MGLWDRLRGLVGAATEAPLRPDEVQAWYAQLSRDAKAEWSGRIRDDLAAMERRGRPSGEWRVAVGRLLFQCDGPSGPVPLHHVRVELWDHDPGALDDFLGAAVTGADGRFEIVYDPNDAGPGDRPDLELRAMDAQHGWDRDGRPLERWERVFTLRGPDDVEDPRFDFGDVRVPWWEYDPQSPVPRVHVPEHGAAPEAYGAGRSFAMLRAVDGVEVAKRKHLAQIALGHPPTIDEVQRDYPPSLTTTREAQAKGSTRDGRWFGDRVLNGFFSTALDHDWDAPGDPDAYRVFHPWNAYEHNPGRCFPSVDVRLRWRNGGLEPVRITLGVRAPGATAPFSPVTRIDVLPTDGARWTAALRAARVSATFDAELSNHLGQCHLNMEQYAIAARRNLRASPLRWLLFPHLREVAVINHAANDFLLGPNGFVTRAGGLSAQGIGERLGHVLGGFDWKGFAPRPPLGEAHRSARASKVFWDLLGTHVDAFLAEHRAGIADAWLEVRRMSDDLVAHSVPFFACSFLQRRAAAGDVSFVQPTERVDYARARTATSGVVRAVSPVTVHDAPGDGDWADLAQMCRYVLFFATFRHAWANNQQWDDGGEVRYTSLALREAPGAPLLPEEDDRMAPGPQEATEMLWISWLLSRTTYGTLVTNDEGDVHPRLVRLVREARAELEALGLDLDRVASRINI